MSTVSEPRQLRVGLVGAGTIAQIAELPALCGAPNVTIAGLVTQDDTETAANLGRWPIERGYDRVERMIDEAALDAIVVVTPKHAHAPYVRAGLLAGLDVYCEKPLTTSIEQAEELVALEQDSRGILMVGFNRRYSEVYRVAHEEFRDRKLQFVVAQKNRVGSEYRATLENGIHLVDILRWFCGEAVDVAAASHAPDPFREDGVTALIRFDSGISAMVAILRCAGEWDERLELYGDATTVRVVAPDTVSTVHDGKTALLDLRPRANGWNDVAMSAGFGPAMDHFLHCVRTRETPLTNGREALKSQQLMQWILSEAGLPIGDDPGRGDS